MLLPRFETKRLILKEVTINDVPSYEKNFVDYEVIRHLSSLVPWPYPKNGVVDFLNNSVIPNQGKDRWVWGLFLKSNPAELVGAIDLWRECKPENRGFWLARRLWRQGLMTEAVRPVMNYAFNDLGFEKLVFTNALGNIASRKVKEKTGARLIGVRPASFVDPAYTEHEVWELEKDSWLSKSHVAVDVKSCSAKIELYKKCDK
jgi:[ribosomal protein S5]-alanine N-acetyltransferase